MITKKINIDGKQVEFRASAAIPRIYRSKFHRDIFRDLMHLQEMIEKNDGKESGIELDSLDLFENVAYIMAKHADPTQPDTPDEWLDQFSTFTIYNILPQLLELWHLNVQTEVEAKKKRNRPAGK